MARDIDLFRQHLLKEREKHLTQAHKLAIQSTGNGDLQAIVVEAKQAELLGRIIGDLKELDQDSSEFIRRFLQ